ncbi:DUF1015 domain-containing protein [Deltaproteobacteria bacterium OttesenSCG-928-K17]|nr:DUF1015 domain-containing protein [Deltaproteobacteria bacterium OttesenSCG-928-K17]
MVEIAPFRGLIYNSDEIKDHGGLLVAPPYDVLDEQQRQACLDLHPHNVLHIDYGQVNSNDEHKWDWHKRSAEIIQKWISEGVLTRLEKPAIFHIETVCDNLLKKGSSIVRHGFVCLMKLQEFNQQSEVRPHEKTFSGHKEERLDLMKKTGANLSHVFGFFPDENRKALNLMAAATSQREADVDFKDYNNFIHRMWINSDENSISEFVELLKDCRVYIADGHHRYETALNYMRWLKESGQAPASCEYVMIYMCPMSDPGLVIFPTHRLVHLESFHPDDLLNRLSKFFKISGKSFTAETEPKVRERFLTKLKKQSKSSFGLYLANRKTYYVLKLLESSLQEEALLKEPKELAALDTVILSNIVFMEALGLTEADLDNPDIISYVSDLDDTIKLIDEKKQSAAFILNPSKVEDILRVTEKGLVMPRKSTFFYPKVTTGLVLNLID